MPPPPPPVQLVIRLPYNRPSSEQRAVEPQHIIWNSEQETILWELISRARMTENTAPDWPALSTHLGVPLPYLLYRVQARFEQDLKGIQTAGGTMNNTPQVVPRALPGDDERSRPSVTVQAGNSNGRTAALTSPTRLRYSGGSSSTFTLRQRRSHLGMGQTPPPKPPSPVDSESEEDSGEEAVEAEERRKEEQETIDRKLQELQRMMSNDLGFARPPRRSYGLASQAVSPTRRNENASGSTSSSVRGSAHGSIGTIPSPPSASQSSSRVRSKPQSPSPSSRHFRNPTTRYPALERAIATTQQSSNQGSSASSFSDVDISDASVSVTESALQDALISQMNRGTSRMYVPAMFLFVH
ncbi:hypothetical protein AURDEDRAFT_156888 [Auricularia subglabra TFB-10046 SS5]|nr:hypothetical protein AURDEDRAFT_156888 [Auricularia subglabra TFB-10046 SS5]